MYSWLQLKMMVMSNMEELEKKLKPLRERYKTAGELERGLILKAVKQYRKEFGVVKSKGRWEDTFETAKEVFAKI